MSRIVTVIVIFSAIACSKSDDEKTTNVASSATSASAAPARIASCDRVAAMSYCAEYTGAYLAQNELALSGSCKKLGGAFVFAECPNTSVLGACTLPTGEVRKLYAGGEAPFDPARAKKECDASYHGAWKDVR